MKIKVKEKEIQKSVSQFLTLKKIFHYRQNSGAFSTPTGGFYHMGINGAPDLVCVINGKYIGLEIKTKYGKQSPSQKEFQGNLEKAGGIYLIIRSVDELEEMLENMDNKKKII